MAVRLDGAAVYVDAQGWRDLAEGSAPERPEVDHLPGMRGAFAAVREPLLRVHLDLTTSAGRFTHLLWARPDAVALLRDRGPAHEGERRLLALPSDHLPVTLARLVGLGPRPQRLEVDSRARRTDVEAWLDDDPAAARAALDRIGADRAWALHVTVAGAVGDAVPLVVVDGPAGPHRVDDEGDPDEVLLRAVAPADVWDELAAILPLLSEVGSAGDREA